MKTIISIVACLCIGYYFFNKSGQVVQPQPIQDAPVIRIVYLQDASKSIVKNGVEIVSSNVFDPVYHQLSADVTIFFGYVTASSTNQFIVLDLPAPTFHRPILASGSSSFIGKKKHEQKYQAQLKVYFADSAAYFINRSNRIEEFRLRIDSMSQYYRSHLSSETDVTTALANAERVFSIPTQNRHVRNILIINSDCKDSFEKEYTADIPGTTIFVTAGKLATDLKINSNKQFTFQSSKEAIQYCINHN